MNEFVVGGEVGAANGGSKIASSFMEHDVSALDGSRTSD